MSIDWKTYEQFDWSNSKQVPMNAAERSLVEEVVCNALGVDNSFTGHLGSASPPGRYAATVVHISKSLSHRFQDAIVNLGFEEIGAKVYKPSTDASREFTKVLPFHNGSGKSLPGIPHPQVQRTLWAGRISCSNPTSHGVAVQEWVVGQTLDLLLADQRSNGAMDVGTAKCILEQMLVEIIVPLWSLGTVWWDIRDANWCFDSSSLKLQVIDVDSLWAYAKEILTTPSDWSRRNRGRETALSRLKQTCWRVLEAQFAHNRSSAMKFHHELWHSSVEPALRELGGQNNHARTQALDAIEQYLIAVFNRI